jgi:hypothetical protein
MLLSFHRINKAIFLFHICVQFFRTIFRSVVFSLSFWYPSIILTERVPWNVHPCISVPSRVKAYISPLCYGQSTERARAYTSPRRPITLLGCCKLEAWKRKSHYHYYSGAARSSTHTHTHTQKHIPPNWSRPAKGKTSPCLSWLTFSTAETNNFNLWNLLQVLSILKVIY